MIGLGIDIIQIDRIRKLNDKFGNRFLKKIFSQTEIEDAQKKGHFINSLAGKFASKEAWIKAVYGLTKEAPSFKNVQILSDKNNKPYIKLQSKIMIIDYHFLISISHDKEYAVAVVAVV